MEVPEGQDGEQDGLLVDVPAKQEGAQRADEQHAQEGPRPPRPPPEGQQRRLGGTTLLNYQPTTAFMYYTLLRFYWFLTRMESRVHTSVTEGVTEGRTE